MHFGRERGSGAMHEDEFDGWLKWRGATSDGAIRTRIFAVRKIEENLNSLGSPHASLDDAFQADGFRKLRDRLKEIREDAQKGGQEFRILMPDSENPLNRLAKWSSWLGQYGQFLANRNAPEDDVSFDQAMEQLRETFLDRMDQFDNLASEDGTFWETEKSYKMDARLGVVAANAEPQRSAAERGKAIYERLCQNAGQGLPLSWRTKGEVWAASPELQHRFFETIASLGNPDEDAGVLTEHAARSLEQLREDGIANLKRGEVLNIVLSVLGTFRPKDSCWFKSRLFDQAAKHLSLPRLFPSYRFELDEFQQFQSFLLKIQSWLDDRGMQPESFEDVQGFLWVALAKDWEEQDLVVEGLTRAAVEAAMDEFDEIGLDGFKSKYGFGKPQRYWVRRPANDDLYPAKAIAGVAYGHVEGGEPKSVREFYAGYGEQQANGILTKLGYEIVDLRDTPEQSSKDAKVALTAPTNLILYGPPGTGKTYATAREAVLLCDGEAPAERDALMARYRELEAEKRIAFVTFHQNFSYEDFVEGLRPVPIETENGEPTGFLLRPRPGVFREIADRARRRPGSVNFAGRTIYRMSLGQADTADKSWVFEESLAGGYALFGFGDINWSDDRFEDKHEILKAVQAAGSGEGITLRSGPVEMTDVFRNKLKVGDVLVISKGMKLFRAIGLVEGEYEYAPRSNGVYCHRRNVRWLWSNPDGLPHDVLQPQQFNRDTIGKLSRDTLNIAKLEELAEQGSGNHTANGNPESFVLIIDEINRANVSKVFGELITLLEPDKRAGEHNALSVKLPYSGEDFTVPANLHIIGTMNTADRSIALLDTALRRRFRFKELAPDTQVEAFQNAVRQTNLPLDKVLDAINDRIEYLIDREHRIGHAFFIACENRADIDAVMRDKVIPLLQEYFFEDWSRIHAVLGDGFIGSRTLKCPLREGEDRPSWFVRPEFGPDAYARLLGLTSAAHSPEVGA